MCIRWHICYYILALGYFYWDIRRTSFTGRGWRFLQMFCVLMACWNTLAFTGHLAGFYLDPQSLASNRLLSANPTAQSLYP